MDPASGVDNTDLPSRVDSTDLRSGVDSTDLTSEVDNRDPASGVDNTDRAITESITESTSEIPAADNFNRATPETSTLENISEFSFQEARNGRFAPQGDIYF
jgi:hypothetical protein